MPSYQLIEAGLKLGPILGPILGPVLVPFLENSLGPTNLNTFMESRGVP